MTKPRNGWDVWYEQWDERYTDQPGDETHPVPYEHLNFWGDKLRQMVMLNDHWIGYMQSEPMGLEDGMTLAFVLYDAGVDVDELILLLDEFEPLEGTIARVGIPLCWLTEPMDHVQDLLSTLDELPLLDAEIQQQMQHTLEEMLGEPPDPNEDWLSLFQAMSLNTAQFLMELTRLLGDTGRLALHAWWQGRLITLLREASSSTRKRKRGSARRKKGAEVPSAFQDLIRGLDMGGLGADEGEEEE
jgi:hypothetical protein